MQKRRGFSLYDIETFLREAGAERVNETAVLSLEEELEDTVSELVNEATVYANYAGRSRLIKSSDIALAKGRGGSARMAGYATARRRMRGRRGTPELVRRKRILQEAVAVSMGAADAPFREA